jgi:hypothetical protein
MRRAVDHDEPGVSRRAATLVLGMLVSVPVVIGFTVLSVGVIVTRAAWTSVWPAPPPILLRR